jgi:hypothetical protein
VPEQLVPIGSVEIGPRFGEDTGSWLLADDRPAPRSRS